jgi:hypothetical protein
VDVHLLSPLGGMDVKQAKKMCVDLAVGRHDAWRKGIAVTNTNTVTGYLF